MTIEGTSQARITVDTRIVIPQHVVFRSFVSETVVLNLHTGKYHGLNQTGGRMLELLQQVPVIADAAGQLAREYDRPAEEIERDLVEFCEELAQRELIEVGSAAAS
jgi:hypothetical protein